MGEEIANLIKKELGLKNPKIAVILGSGLGDLVESLENKRRLSYKDIPGSPTSTVEGHKGELVSGTLFGKEILCVNGRVHLYEGFDPNNIANAIYTLKDLGIKQLIVTNAAGSLNKDIAPGSLMLINDHINFSGRNPLVGPNNDFYGPRFPAMNGVYTPRLLERMKQIAQKNNIEVHEGIYLMVLGPNFETAAEIRMFTKLGADAVGCSTVPEVIVAAQCSMEILGISVITNYGAGMVQNTPSHLETLQNANKAAESLTKLITEFIREEG